SAGMASGCLGKGAAIVGGVCTMRKGASASYEGTCGDKAAMNTMSMAGHECDACADMALCEKQLKEAGSQFQVVPLKNGVMYVFTADNPRGVRSVQTAISRRTERINAIVAADNAKLCPECKQMRGALASGKLNREVVNIEGG